MVGFCSACRHKVINIVKHEGTIEHKRSLSRLDGTVNVGYGARFPIKAKRSATGSKILE